VHYRVQLEAGRLCQKGQVNIFYIHLHIVQHFIVLPLYKPYTFYCTYSTLDCVWRFSYLINVICIQLIQRILYRVETKTLFSFSRKAKISENSLTFRENSRHFSLLQKISRKFSFLRKFSFFFKVFAKKFSSRDGCREKFPLSRKISKKNIVFLKIFHQCFRSGYTFKWLLNPDPYSEWRIFAKTFGEMRKFSQKL
jgi:hypothetical protein